MPRKDPKSEEAIAARRAASLNWYHTHKADFSEEKKAKMRDKGREYSRQWRERNPEKAAESARKTMQRRREEQPERLRELMRESYYRNHEKRKAEKRAIHDRNRDAANEARRQHYHTHKDGKREERSVKALQARVDTPWRGLLHAAQSRAKKRSLPYFLTEMWAAKRWTGLCEVTGLEFRLGQRGFGPKFWSPSIDKIDASKGYVPENCRFVLWGVNSFKHDATDEDMVLVARAIVAAFDKKEAISST